MSWLSTYAEVENCYFMTKGRRTGNPHEIEIWFGVVDDTLYLISGNGETADWYRNALANPGVIVRIDRDVRAGVARPVTDPAERRSVGELMGVKYPWNGDPSIGLTCEAWCFDVPLLAVSTWTDL